MESVNQKCGVTFDRLLRRDGAAEAAAAAEAGTVADAESGRGAEHHELEEAPHPGCTWQTGGNQGQTQGHGVTNTATCVCSCNLS